MYSHYPHHRFHSCTATVSTPRPCPAPSDPSPASSHAPYLVHAAARLLALGGERLDAPLGDAVLVQSGLQLALDVVIVRLQLRQLGNERREVISLL